MGQDTDAYVGVAVNYDLTYENLEIIKKLCFEDENDCYFHPRENVGCEDEVVKALDGDDCDDILNEILEAESKDEFDKMVVKHTSVEEIHFIKVVVTVYARNISRRNCPTIWDETTSNIDEVLEKITEYRDEFLALGVPPEKIKIQGLMNDSY